MGEKIDVTIHVLKHCSYLSCTLSSTTPRPKSSGTTSMIHSKFINIMQGVLVFSCCIFITKEDIHKTAVVASCFDVIGLCGALSFDNAIHKKNGKLSHHWACPGTSLMSWTCGATITREDTMSDLIAGVPGVDYLHHDTVLI